MILTLCQPQSRDDQRRLHHHRRRHDRMSLDPESLAAHAFPAGHFDDGVGDDHARPAGAEEPADLRVLCRAARHCSALLARRRTFKCVVLAGAGGNFCSGGDVHEIIGPLTKMDHDGLLEFTRMTGDLVRAMRACPQPIVAAVDGVCAGAGAIIAMASDLRLAAPDAKTAFLFTRVGLSGADMGACAILPRIIGHGRAAELLFTGRSMSAEEGLRLGFLEPRQHDVLADAQALARRPRRGPSPSRMR